MKARTILIADGHADSREVFKTILEWRGYRVYQAETGPLALAFVRGHPIDLVVTEVSLPGLDGLQLVRSIRREGATRSLPILIVTADLSATPGMLLAAGSNGCLVKPCSPQRLLEEVERQLEMANVESEDARRIPTGWLDVVAGTLGGPGAGERGLDSARAET